MEACGIPPQCLVIALEPEAAALRCVQVCDFKDSQLSIGWFKHTDMLEVHSLHDLRGSQA